VSTLSHFTRKLHADMNTTVQRLAVSGWALGRGAHLTDLSINCKIKLVFV